MYVWTFLVVNGGQYKHLNTFISFTHAARGKVDLPVGRVDLIPVGRVDLPVGRVDLLVGRGD